MSSITNRRESSHSMSPSVLFWITLSFNLMADLTFQTVMMCMMRCKTSVYISFLLSYCMMMLGCGTPEEAAIERRPRPVATRVLSKQLPPKSALVTASAAAWKTEELGFEVSGRIEFVADQNTEIDGRIRDAAGNLIVEGTPIARIESERYQLAVAIAESSVARAEQDLIAGQTELNETIAAQIDAATSSAELAKIEYVRSKRLREQNANSQSDLDSAKVTYENAVAEVRQYIAAEKSQKAEIESLKSALAQSQQNLRDAVRDLEDCTLYSSFQGKVAETSVVPGSLVDAGAPVATLQMMDPIKVELEVSGEQSRKLQRTETLPVHVMMPDGSKQIHEGFLHQIDPSADSLTRTFTLTILVLNKRLKAAIQPDVATTRDIWRLDLGFIPGANPGDLFVEENAILRDADGYYLWQVTNATIQSRTPKNQTFKVRKLRLIPGDLKVPYLGDLIFQKVIIQDDQFDPSSNIVIGKLEVDGIDPNQWDGDEVLLNPLSRWMLRPGDLVKVDLSNSLGDEGYYVPMDAISRKAGQSHIFAVETSGETSTVRSIPVEVDFESVHTTTSSLRRIDPIEDISLDGIKYVTKGAHFLIDGETVNEVVDAEIAQ